MLYWHCMDYDQQIAVRISKRLLDVLDDVRRAERDVPRRAEMIRRLIARAGGAKADEEKDRDELRLTVLR